MTDEQEIVGLRLSTKEQVWIMEQQLSNFDILIEKIQYISQFFDPDPEFTQEARDIVRSNLCKQEKNNGE